MDGRFLRLFEDLEAEAAGRALHERSGEFSDLVAGEAADHSLIERLAGSRGATIGLTAAGVRFAGRLQRVSSTWVVMVTDGGGEVLISLAYIDELMIGSRAHATPEESLSFASPLREWREEGQSCAIAVVGRGGEVRMLMGSLALVAADYVEVVEASEGTSARSAGAPGGRLLIPLARIAFVRPEGRVL